MRICVRPVSEWREKYIKALEQAVIVPFNPEIDKGVQIELSQSDDEYGWETIKGVCQLIADSRAAMIMVNLDALFIKKEVQVQPYEHFGGVEYENTIMTKQGRQIFNVFKQEIEKRQYEMVIVDNPDPEIVVFVMRHSGLIY